VFAGSRHSTRALQLLAAEQRDEATLAPLRLVEVALVRHAGLAAARTRGHELCRPLVEMTSNQTEQRDREQTPSSSGPKAQEPLRSPMKFLVWIVILFAGVVALGMMDP
jgi:hypothetical protein